MQNLSRHGVGGSEIAAACGISRYRSRYGLWLQKTGREPEFAGNEYTRLGTMLEPYARQMYANLTGCDIEVPASSMFHPEFSWHRATPDGWRVNDRKHGVQFKCTGFYVGNRWKYEIPIEILAQCQWEAHVAGFDQVDLAALIGTDELAWERFILGDITDPMEVISTLTMEIFPIYRSNYEIERLKEGCDNFWNLVVTDTQPPIDPSPECKRHADRRAGGPVTLEYLDMHEEVEAWCQAQEDFDAAERRLEACKNAVRHRMGELGASRINTAAGPVIWTKRKDGGTQLRQPPGWSKDPQ